MNKAIIKSYRVRASVYPTPHNKIWLSSGRVPLYLIVRPADYLNSLVLGEFFRKGEINNLGFSGARKDFSMCWSGICLKEFVYEIQIYVY